MTLPTVTDGSMRIERYLFGPQTSNREKIVQHTFAHSREPES